MVGVNGMQQIVIYVLNVFHFENVFHLFDIHRNSRFERVSDFNDNRTPVILTFHVNESAVLTQPNQLLGFMFKDLIEIFFRNVDTSEFFAVQVISLSLMTHFFSLAFKK